MAMRLGNIVFDCADTHRVATFYSELTGWPIVRTDDDWIDLQADGGVKLSFQLAPDHVPPKWLDAAHPQQAHIDLDVDDLDAEQARALELGATLLDVSEAPDSFRVFADPAGHPFCLCAS
jgi:catechol 2,3-dioxygenase-like lactoylglutathione lyase family enzyme